MKSKRSRTRRSGERKGDEGEGGRKKHQTENRTTRKMTVLLRHKRISTILDSDVFGHSLVPSSLEREQIIPLDCRVLRLCVAWMVSSCPRPWVHLGIAGSGNAISMRNWKRRLWLEQTAPLAGTRCLFLLLYQPSNSSFFIRLLSN